VLTAASTKVLPDAEDGQGEHDVDITGPFGLGVRAGGVGPRATHRFYSTGNRSQSYDFGIYNYSAVVG
jgi:hypothetical protein